MKCKYDEETLKLIALAIGTSKGKETIENHYLNYLAQKLTGIDGLSLDSENTDIFKRLKGIVKELEKWLSYLKNYLSDY